MNMTEPLNKMDRATVNLTEVIHTGLDLIALVSDLVWTGLG